MDRSYATEVQSPGWVNSVANHT